MRTEPRPPGFPVVGMVASAGGFKAFVLVPHLDPKRESLIAPLLSRFAAMPAVEAQEGMRLEPDHIYVIPPNKFLSVQDGTLRLSGTIETAVPYTSIDAFLRSLAESESLERLGEVTQLHRLHTMGELAAVIAHELNQPLAAIASYSEASLGQVRRADRDDDKLARNLERIADQAQRASRTIRELRAFLMKGEQGRAPGDLNAIARAAGDLVEPQVRAAQVQLAFELAPGLLPVLAQEIHIEHVLVNLLQNSLDALRDNGVREGRITVRTRPLDSTGAQVSVTDNGPGVDTQALEKVFEAFHTTKRNGLGLGLRICRSILEAHGGHIWAAPGPGGRFHFTLPYAP